MAGRIMLSQYHGRPGKSQRVVFEPLWYKTIIVLLKYTLCRLI